MILCRSIHVAANGMISLFLLAEQYPIVYINHIFFIHSSVDGQLGCFHVLAIVNSAAMNIGVHVSFQIIVFFGYMPRSGVAGSCGNSFVVFWGEPLCCSSQWLPQLTFPPTAGKNSKTFLVVDALDSFEEDWGQRFCRTSLYGSLSGVFLTVTLGRWVWRGGHR